MTAPDLTPAEARAEVEAFMGEGWRATARESSIVRGAFVVKAQRGDIVVGAMKDTYRAAVSALKQAWRDAVRPWVRSAYSCGWSCANGGWDRDGNIDRDVNAVLKEDS